MVRTSGALLRVLVDQNSTVIAGRLVGAYEFLGMPQFAAEIRQAMEAAGSIIRVTNPFEDDAPLLVGGSPRATSSHVARLRMLWVEMRPAVLNAFAGSAPRSVEPADYLAEVEERYVSDAYNSLSIEGYRVTPGLIERERSSDGPSGTPAAGQSDLDAIAARGYYQAFRLVKGGIAEILSGKAFIDVIDGGFQSWYREMFAPAVLAGLLQPSQLAGYRSVQVSPRGSRHVPPSADAVVDCMEEYLELMRAETEPVVRAVLGHFVFVYIHPYPDGNGRIARFIMNVALASGGYPWTVIRNSGRGEYLAALEVASTGRDIVALRPFRAPGDGGSEGVRRAGFAKQSCSRVADGANCLPRRVSSVVTLCPRGPCDSLGHVDAPVGVLELRGGDRGGCARVHGDAGTRPDHRRSHDAGYGRRDIRRRSQGAGRSGLRTDLHLVREVRW